MSSLHKKLCIICIKQKGKLGYLGFKIDLEKAYECVYWSFLEVTLKGLGLPLQAIQIIMALTTSNSLYLKWNNEILYNFRPNKGPGQGDPLLPYLFVLCMEKLALLIQEKFHNDQWQSVRISKNGPQVSHLFFTNDCLLFTGAKISQVRLVQQVLDDFCKALGVRVRIHKSRFMASRNISMIKNDEFTSIIGFNHTIKLDKYHGFPFFSGRVKKSDFLMLLIVLRGIWLGGKPNCWVELGGQPCGFWMGSINWRWTLWFKTNVKRMMLKMPPFQHQFEIDVKKDIWHQLW